MPILDALEAGNQERPRQAAVQSTRRVRRNQISSTIAVLAFRYNAPEGQFIQENMPDVLASRMAAETFKSRIQGINKHLSRYISLSDYSPNIRAFLIAIYLSCAIGFAAFLPKMGTMQLWGTLFGGLVVLTMLLAVSYRPRSFVTFTESELERFNSLDEGLGIVWESARQEHQVMYAVTFNKAVLQVPWNIVIRRVTASEVAMESNGSSESSEWLPSYSATAE
ncbi:UNVERIFIED_CONTAM: hypothetical protein HDU68_001608, partial [Siphonaria sp. JEL0065]